MIASWVIEGACFCIRGHGRGRSRLTVGSCVVCSSVFSSAIARAHDSPWFAVLQADQQQAAAQRALGVLGEEDRVEVVVQPGEPEEVALLGRAGRVVGEHVEQRVEIGEGACAGSVDSSSAASRPAPDGVTVGRISARERAGSGRGSATRVSRNVCWVASRAGFSATAEGISASSAGRRTSESRSELVQARLGRPQGRRQLLQRLLERRPAGWRRRRAQRSVESTNSRQVARRGGRAPRRSGGSCGSSGGCSRRRTSSAVADPGEVSGERLEAPQGGGERLAVAARAPAAALRAAAPGTRGCRLSSAARIWSGWTFGWVCASGIVAPSGGVLPLVPGSTSITMSLRPVFGRRSRVASEWISFSYLVSMSMRDHRDAVLEADRADPADLDPGDVDRLSLAGRHRLRRAELGVQLVEVLAEARHPTRERRLLVVEDDQQREQRQQNQHDDADEVTQVVSDRSLHLGILDRVGRAGGGRRPVQVGDGVLEAGLARLDRRHAVRDAAGFRAAARSCCRRTVLLGCPGHRPGWDSDGNRPAAGLEADVGTVAVEVLALPARSRWPCRRTRGSWAGRR